MNSHRRLRNLCIESLDKREVMAGNVTALITPDGDFLVQGDDKANNLVIRQESATSERIVVAPLFPGETSINGQDKPVLLPAVRRHMILDMRGGADSLFVGDGSAWNVPGNVVGVMGEGQNTLGLWGVKSSGGFSLSGGSGRDAVSLYQASGKAATSLSLGEGDDLFEVFDSTIHSLSVELAEGSDSFRVSHSEISGLAVNTGTGNDWVEIVGDAILGLETTTIKGPSLVMTGSGNDQVALGPNLRIETSGKAESFQLGLGSGDDVVGIQGLVVVGDGELQTDLGNGNDVTKIVRTAGSNTLRVYGRDGADTVELEGVSARDMYLEAGNGTDAIYLSGVRVNDKLFIDAGAGTDAVSLDSVSVFGDAYIDGGTNPSGIEDRLSVRRLTVRGRATFRNF